MASPVTDKPLFTPGPLTTSPGVKQAMLRDLGSRDAEFVSCVREVRQRLLAIAGLSQEAGYEAVLMQGSGTFALESVFSSCLPRGGRLLVLINGAYGQRMAQIARRHELTVTELRFCENEPVSAAAVRLALESDDVDAVAVVHCETTSGIMNPILAVGQQVAAAGKTYIVDSMSAFGGVEFDFQASSIDALISSANKCIQGVPGFAFVLCRRQLLEQAEGWSRTLSLDLISQWRGLEQNGQFRFTPPTHALLAFRQALLELEQEGGVPGRARRYAENHRIILEGLQRIGLRPYVPEPLQGHIITSFHFPDDPDFSFDEFYLRLHERGFVIYPGKVSNADCFRIGNIGHLFPDDMRALVEAIGQERQRKK